jgi:hypothetical protein
LAIAERPDVIVGCEVTGCFPDDGVRVRLGVPGITERTTRFNVCDRMSANCALLFDPVKHPATRLPVVA